MQLLIYFFSVVAHSLHTPACLMTPHVFLDSDGRFSHPQVLSAGEPAANGLLDVDTS